MEVHLLLMDGVLPEGDGHLLLLKNTQVLQTKVCQWNPSNERVCNRTAVLELPT